MITVRLPSTLKTRLGRECIVDQPIGTITDLVDALEQRDPGLRAQLDDAVFNFAVNDEMLLHRVREHRLKDGDIVEVVPAIAGGSREQACGVMSSGRRVDGTYDSKALNRRHADTDIRA